MRLALADMDSDSLHHLASERDLRRGVRTDAEVAIEMWRRHLVDPSFAPESAWP
jgi:hypothetical protein